MDALWQLCSSVAFSNWRSQLAYVHEETLLRDFDGIGYLFVLFLNFLKDP